MKDYGVQLAVDMIRQLQAGGIQGVHFCTLNLEKSITRILETLGLAGDVSHSINKLIAVCLIHPTSRARPLTINRTTPCRLNIL